MMTKKRLYMDVHVIQTLPPSNINRDDTGSPKTAQYGGVRRARVSSQAWKRAMRQYFNQQGAEENVGIRTKDIVNYVARKVRALNPDLSQDVAIAEAEKAINNAGITTKEHMAKALFFLGNSQADGLARAVVSGKNEKADRKELQQIIANNPEIDIALFGRMVADAPELNTDASCQVAHAISTHAIQTEFDYFTAMDDLLAEDQTGAGMLGNIEYNSSTLYRYANISVHNFAAQLGEKEATVAACKLFVEAFVNSLPTGKENTFAHQTIPSFVMVTLREDRPVNLVSAFEKPVRTSDENGYIDISIDRLADEYIKTEKIVLQPEANFYLKLSEKSLDNRLGRESINLSELLSQLGEAISSHLEEVGE